jgi:hypothetical protein
VFAQGETCRVAAPGWTRICRRELRCTCGYRQPDRPRCRPHCVQKRRVGLGDSPRLQGWAIPAEEPRDACAPDARIRPTEIWGLQGARNGSAECTARVGAPVCSGLEAACSEAGGCDLMCVVVGCGGCVEIAVRCSHSSLAPCGLDSARAV